MSKAADAFRTISEVADELGVPKHVLRFWEVKFPQIRPMKRGGGRRFYRPEDMELLRGIRQLLHSEGYTIKGVQKILRRDGADVVKERGTAAVANGSAGPSSTAAAPHSPPTPPARVATAPAGAAHPQPRQGRTVAQLPTRRTTAPAVASTGLPASTLQAIKAAIVELESLRKLLANDQAPARPLRGAA